MSKELNQELLDTAKWFHEHVDEISDMEKRQEFLTKTCDMLLWLLGRVAEDLQKIEGRNEKKGQLLLVPHHLRRDGGNHV